MSLFLGALHLNGYVSSCSIFFFVPFSLCKVAHSLCLRVALLVGYELICVAVSGVYSVLTMIIHPLYLLLGRGTSWMLRKPALWENYNKYTQQHQCRFNYYEIATLRLVTYFSWKMPSETLFPLCITLRLKKSLIIPLSKDSLSNFFLSSCTFFCL